MSETETTTPPAPEADPSDPETSVRAIKAELEETQRRWQESTRRAQQAETAVSALRQERDAALQNQTTAEMASVSNALDAAERERDLIRGQIQAAVEAADAGKVAELTVRAAEIGAQITQLRTGKEAMEAQRNQALRPPPTPPQTPPTPSDPLAAMDPRSAAWLRQHKDAAGNLRYLTDQSFQNRVTAAHFDAIAEGHSEFSPEYYAHIDRRVGVTKPAPAAEQPRPQPPVQTYDAERGNGAPPAAPSRPAASYTDNARRGGDDNHIPRDFINTAVNLYGLTRVEGGKKVPDMGAIAAAWRESREMARRGEFKVGDPWAGAR